MIGRLVTSSAAMVAWVSMRSGWNSARSDTMSSSGYWVDNVDISIISILYI